MKIEIKSFWGIVLFEGDFSSVAEALVAAVKKGADLSGANLYGANLRSADLSGANLYGADLRSADLSGANLYGANLYGANLSGANLSGANLSGANLSGANLRSADLYGADLRSADLSGANLYGANLSGANLSGANLSGANLYGANLRSADLSGAKAISPLQASQILIVPPEGDVVGWKKCADDIIAKLLIPDGAVRHNATGRKCRAEYAKVIALFKDGKKFAGPAFTKQYGPLTEYIVGEVVRPDSFEKDRWNECAPGIHFFITREEAEAYN